MGAKKPQPLPQRALEQPAGKPTPPPPPPKKSTGHIKVSIGQIEFEGDAEAAKTAIAKFLEMMGLAP